MLYFYTYFYFLGLFYVILVDSALNIWIGIEVIILFFIALVASVSFGQLGLLNAMQYFVLQTLASFVILSCLVVSSYFFSLSWVFIASLAIAIFTNIALFPFFYWYFDFTYYLPPFIFFLVLGPQNLAPCIIYFSLSVELSNYWTTFLVIFLLVLGLVVSTVLSVTAVDIRGLIIWSSLANTSWIVLSLYVGESIFILYYWIYLGFLLFFCWGIHIGETLPFGFISMVFSTRTFSLSTFLQAISLLAIAGVPPLPIFFSKFIVIYSVLFNANYNSYLSLVCIVFVSCSFVLLLMYTRRLCYLVLNWSVTL